MISYQEENFHEFKEDAMRLFKLHKDEIDLFDKPLDIDIKCYEDMYDSGALKVFTVREKGNLIGYCAFFLFLHPHHKTSLQAKQDVLFIEKVKRGRGIPFLKFCEDRLREYGVDIIHQCVPEINDFSLILKRLGYRKLETIYTRSL